MRHVRHVCHDRTAAELHSVKAAGEACGLPNVHPHMLRHSAGYCLVNQGQDMRLIQDFLGHKTPTMTQHYTAISPHRLAALRVR